MDAIIRRKRHLLKDKFQLELKSSTGITLVSDKTFFTVKGARKRVHKVKLDEGLIVYCEDGWLFAANEKRTVLHSTEKAPDGFDGNINLSAEMDGKVVNIHMPEQVFAEGILKVEEKAKRPGWLNTLIAKIRNRSKAKEAATVKDNPSGGQEPAPSCA